MVHMWYTIYDLYFTKVDITYFIHLFFLNTFSEYIFTVEFFEFMLDELMKYNSIW